MFPRHHPWEPFLDGALCWTGSWGDTWEVCLVVLCLDGIPPEAGVWLRGLSVSPPAVIDSFTEHSGSGPTCARPVLGGGASPGRQGLPFSRSVCRLWALAAGPSSASHTPPSPAPWYLCELTQKTAVTLRLWTTPPSESLSHHPRLRSDSSVTRWP